MDNSVNDVNFLKYEHDVIEKTHEDRDDFNLEEENLKDSKSSQYKLLEETYPSQEKSLNYPQSGLPTSLKNPLEIGDFSHLVPEYIMRFKLYKTNRCGGHLLNRLQLDNVTDSYYYLPYTGTLDGCYFNPGLNVLGNPMDIYAYRVDKTIEFGLNSTKIKNLKPILDPNDNLVGLTTSEIMSYIGDLSKLKLVPYSDAANVNIFQKACLFKTCGKKYILFNFNMVNYGMGLAQKILFSDLFSKNISIKKESIFLDGILVPQKDISINKYNKVIIDIGNLDKGESKNLIIVAEIGNVCNRRNYATIAYVSDVFKSSLPTMSNSSQLLLPEGFEGDPLQEDETKDLSNKCLGDVEVVVKPKESLVVDIEQKVSNSICIYNVNCMNNCCSCCCR